jgi:hypothetical protein
VDKFGDKIMNNEIQKFDPSTLMDGVKQRIKATFVSLIPDDHWEQLCKKEMDAFFREGETRFNNNNSYPSEFRKVCNEVMTEMAKQKISEGLEEYKSSVWENNKVKSSEQLKQLLIDNAPQVFANTFSNMFQEAINRMKTY